jgi:primosomal protein N' (replication factor Y)
MTYHRADDSLTCHHCGKRQPVPGHCPACAGDRMVHVGHGTERVGHVLAGYFPQARLARIDRDSTRRRGSMLALLADIAAGRIDILIGTQMLAKGHHFPNVALVGILDADAGLYSSDFRAPERMAQLIVQVSGRAGRAEHPGEVVIQTHHPGHPFLQRLIDQGYAGFAETALKERRESELPPYTHLALLRAEATAPAPAMNFLEAARAALPARATGLDIYGPTPAPQPKRAGRYRAQLILQSAQRAPLHKLLKPWLQRLEALPEARRVHWSLDIDPQEML